MQRPSNPLTLARLLPWGIYVCDAGAGAAGSVRFGPSGRARHNCAFLLILFRLACSVTLPRAAPAGYEPEGQDQHKHQRQHANDNEMGPRSSSSSGAVNRPSLLLLLLLLLLLPLCFGRIHFVERV